MIVIAGSPQEAVQHGGDDRQRACWAFLFWNLLFALWHVRKLSDLLDQTHGYTEGHRSGLERDVWMSAEFMIGRGVIQECCLVSSVIQCL